MSPGFVMPTTGCRSSTPFTCSIARLVNSSCARWSEFDRIVRRDRQCHWNRKQMTSGKAHVFDDGRVIFRAHKPIKRTEASCCEQLEIAERAFGQTHCRQLFCAFK